MLSLIQLMMINIVVSQAKRWNKAGYGRFISRAEGLTEQIPSQKLYKLHIDLK